MKSKKSQTYHFVFQKINFLLLMAIAFILHACGSKESSSSSSGVNIPEDVQFVASIDFKNIMLKDADFTKSMDKDFWENMDNKEAKEVWENILKDNLDFQTKISLFGKPADKDKKQNYWALAFKVKDAAKFEESLSKLKGEDKDKPKIKSESGFKYAQSKHSLLGWKDKQVLLIVADELEEKELVEKYKSIINTSSSASLMSKNADFKAIENQGKDISFWWDGKLHNSLGNMSDVSKSSKTMEEILGAYTYSTASLSFDKGEMSLETSFHLDESKSSKYEKVLRTAIEDKVIKGIPLTNPVAMLGLAMDMRTVFDLVKDEKEIKQMDEQMKKQGLSAQDIFEMFEGDFLIAVQDLNIPEMLKGKYVPELVASIGIKNKKTYDKIFAQIEVFGLLQKKGNYYEIKSKPSYYMSEKNGVVYFAMTEQVMKNIVSGKNKMNADRQKIVQGNSLVVYMNIRDIYKQLPAEIKNEMFADPNNKYVIEQFESFYVDVAPVKDHHAKTKVVLSFTDKNKNALSILREIGEKTKPSKAIMDDNARKPATTEDSPDGMRSK
jgi:hypothetical protein